MERHALVYHLQRQRRLAQQLIVRQPLTLYMAERRQLPRSLGLTPNTTAQPNLRTRHIPAQIAPIMDSSAADSAPTRPIIQPTTDESPASPFDSSQHSNPPRSDKGRLGVDAGPLGLSSSPLFTYEQQPVAEPNILSTSEETSDTRQPQGPHTTPQHPLSLREPDANATSDTRQPQGPHTTPQHPSLRGPDANATSDTRQPQGPLSTPHHPLSLRGPDDTISTAAIDHTAELPTLLQETAHNEHQKTITDSDDSTKAYAIEDGVEDQTSEKSDRPTVTDTSSETKQTPPRDHDNHPARPVEEVKARPRRGRITEVPASLPTTGQAQDNAPMPPASQPQTPASQRTTQPQKKNAPPSEADTLFQPRETPREPLEWLDMLRKSRWGDLAPTSEPTTASLISIPTEDASTNIAKQAQIEPPQAQVAPFFVNASSQNEQTAQVVRPVPETRANSSSELRSLPAEPLSQRTRRFLRPLIGFDPAQVRVHQSAPAARVAASHQADAVAIGNDIAIGTGHADDEPQTLGLLAHELTHVARRHEPRFVPPVVENRNPTTGIQQTRPTFQRSTGISQAATTSPGRLQTPTDEESLAQLVEQQVTRVARGEAAGDTLHQASTAPARPDHPSALPNGRALNPTRDTNWGNLPAPWEPLPDWLATSSPAPEQSSTFTLNAPLAPQLSPIVNATVSNTGGTQSTGGTGSGNVVQRAGLERSLGATQANQAAQPAVPTVMQGPEPDLDELAQQVYTLLKRRLGVEHRRMS